MRMILKNLLLFVLLLTVSLSACKKNGEIKCIRTILAVKNTVTIDDEGYQECTQGLCTDYTLSGYSKEEYAADLEAEGYECEY